MSTSYQYSGTDILEDLSSMTGYNAYLSALFLNHLRGGQQVLDFGAGIGTFAALLQPHLPTRITCVEPDATQRMRLMQRNFPSFASTQNCPDDFFDGIYTCNVLEHIPDDRKALRELHRIAKPNAVVACWVPAFPCLWTSLDNKVDHQRRYTKESLQDAFTASGFEVSHVSYRDPVGFMAALFAKATEKMGVHNSVLNPTTIKAYDQLAVPVTRLLDPITAKLFGKNVFLLANKPA